MTINVMLTLSGTGSRVWGPQSLTRDCLCSEQGTAGRLSAGYIHKSYFYFLLFFFYFLRFLGTEIPNVEYPRLNNAEQFRLGYTRCIGLQQRFSLLLFLLDPFPSSFLYLWRGHIKQNDISLLIPPLLQAQSHYHHCRCFPHSRYCRHHCCCNRHCINL